MSATQKSVEVGEPMLSEFIAQSRAIERNLGELHSKACDVEGVVNDAVARPTEILASAQAQADQLERVCGAVKKVFSRLSQATLDAKTQSGVCADVTKQAAAQVGAITSQSVGAARTLREWTEEAVRAQARLERTLIACPTIHETHPGNAIRRVPQLNAKSSGRLANPSGAIGELAVLPTPGAATALKQETVKPTSRAEEISHLIEDAKRAPV